MVLAYSFMSGKGNTMSVMHFYTTEAHEPVSGWTPEGVSGYVFSSEQPGTVGFYRWRHPESNLHFYTVDPTGEAATALGYVFERIECFVPSDGREGTVPLYRWYHAESGDHFFTQDKNGELGPGSGYVAEGIACVVFPTKVEGSTELYRWASGGESKQTWCIRLSSGGSVVFFRNYHLNSFEEAKAMGESVLRQYKDQYGEGSADKAEVPKAGPC